jgi:CubicO group peptidase (beta-lactamase class C family)
MPSISVRLKTIFLLLLFALAPLLSVANESRSVPPAQTDGAPSLSPDNPSFQAVVRRVKDGIAAGEFPSIAIAVARHKKVLWEAAFGWADKEKHLLATPHTMYHLASVTKTFTGAGIMKLREQGRLNLDKPMNDYLGKAKLWSTKWDPREATIRRIATHMGGLATYDQVCFPDESNCYSSYDTMLNHYGVIIWQPGKHFDYSNLGYGVLSAGIAHTTGKSYAEFLQDELFKPLTMTEGSIAPRPGMAQPYDEHGTPTLPHVSVAQGASSASCSADSLLKFAMFNLKDHVSGQKPILSDADIDAMHNETVPTGEPEQSYGFGWWINNNQHGYRVVYDAGGTLDSKALLYLVPEEDIAVVVLSNGPAVTADKIVDDVLAILLPRYAADLATTSPQGATTVTPTDGASTSAADRWRIGKWKGDILTYVGPRSVTLEVEGSGKGTVQIGSQTALTAERLRFLDNGFVVRARADLETPDANRRKPYVLGFELYRDRDELYGSVTTWSQAGTRDGGLFSYFVRLHKVSG